MFSPTSCLASVMFMAIYEMDKRLHGAVEMIHFHKVRIYLITLSFCIQTVERVFS